MQVSPKIKGIVSRVFDGHSLTRDEIVYLLSTDHKSLDAGFVRLAKGRDLIGNCTHEPNLLGAIAGANLFWAEVGANPRDTESETSQGRGRDVKSYMEMFKETDCNILQGPSMIYRENKDT